MFNSYQEAQAAWREDAAMLEAMGVYLPSVTTYTPEPWKRDSGLAMDAQPALATAPNGSIPALLTTSIDPTVTKVLFTPSKAAKIYGEKRAGDWTDTTRLFPVGENVGEVSGYGDYNSNGSADVNVNWPERQSYLFQVVEQLGDLEIQKAGRGQIKLAQEKALSSATALTKFGNLSYFFGIAGLQNYGALNDPSLPAPITPASKAYNGGAGKSWWSGGSVQATANEIYLDVENLFGQLVLQTGGLVEAEDKIVLAMSPQSAVALKTTNIYNVNVEDLLKKNFPNLRIETAVQYGAITPQNPQGVAAGNIMQMFVETLEGQETVFCGFNEKLRSHGIVRDLSSYKQKKTAGTWGCIYRQPFAVASMLGI